MPPPSTMTALQRYVSQILADDARRIAERNAERKAPTDPLSAAICVWWESLPKVTRHRRYTLAEISDALLIRTGHRYADRHISAALQSAGWTRSRSWRKADCDRRFFTPYPPQP